MANIVDNRINIEGDAETLMRLSEFVKSERYDFSLIKITPNPSTRIIDNYPEVTYRVNATSYYVNLQTAWDPPFSEMEELSRIFPGIVISIEFDWLDDYERGYAVYINGKEEEFYKEEYGKEEGEDEDVDVDEVVNDDGEINGSND